MNASMSKYNNVRNYTRLLVLQTISEICEKDEEYFLICDRVCERIRLEIYHVDSSSFPQFEDNTIAFIRVSVRLCRS